MSVATPMGVEEYLKTAFDPDCDFVDGEIIERNVGKKKHSWTQSRIVIWFDRCEASIGLAPMTEMRMQVAGQRFRIPDVIVVEMPMPEGDVLTSPPYLCVEVMSPEDTMARLQDRLDDYLAFGVNQIWVIDPWKNRGWSVTASGWATAADRIMRTSDGRFAMPLADVLLP